MPVRRWRRVQNLDPSWQYEEQDPSFRPEYTRSEGETDVQGWRPLAHVWYVGAPEEWRVIIEPDGPTSPRYDHGTLDLAKAFVVGRCGGI